MSPRKALDESLLQQLQSMRESPDGEETTQANKRTRLDVAPGKLISNLTLEDSDSESEENEPEVSNDSNNESMMNLVMNLVKAVILMKMMLVVLMSVVMIMMK